MQKSSRGFTIVELLVVIVVIAILAAITIVSYTSLQERARDAKRKQDVSQIAKLLAIYELDNGPMYTGSGCGGYGNGSGYFNIQNGSTYPKSIMQCLIDSGITSTVIQDEKASCSGLDCRTYMKSTCVQNGQIATYVYANLETEGHTGTDTDSTCNATYDTLYGMNYWVRVN